MTIKDTAADKSTTKRTKSKRITNEDARSKFYAKFSGNNEPSAKPIVKKSDIRYYMVRTNKTD